MVEHRRQRSLREECYPRFKGRLWKYPYRASVQHDTTSKREDDKFNDNEHCHLHHISFSFASDPSLT